MSKRKLEPLLPVAGGTVAGGTVAVAQAKPQQTVEVAPAQTANQQHGIASSPAAVDETPVGPTTTEGAAREETRPPARGRGPESARATPLRSY